MTIPAKWLTGGAALAVVLVLFLTRHRGPTPDPSKPYRDALARMAHQHSLDSAEAANAYEVKRREADSLQKVAIVSTNSAARLRRWADSVARVKPSGDTAAMTPSGDVVPRIAYDSLSVAFDTLTHAFGTLTNAYRGSVETASLAYTAWMRAEGQLSQERGVWEDERTAWRETVKRLKPCKVLGLIGCPTLAVGYGVALYQGRVISVPTATVGIPVKLW